MTSLFKLCGIATALLMISSCTLQRVDESSKRAERDAATASQYLGINRNQQATPPRETVIFSDKPWVSTDPIAATRGLPSALDCNIAYRPAGSVSIVDVAQAITKECGVTVLVSPDAINPSLNAVKPGTSNQGTTPPAAITTPNPDNLAGLLPAGVIGASGNAANTYSARGQDFSSYSTANQISGINYSGKSSGLLDLATARLGLSWHYSSPERAVRVNYFETKVFDVYAFGDKQTIASTVTSGMTTTAGTGTGSSGGSTSSSNSGVSGDSGSNQSTKVTLDSSILEDIQKNVQSMLSPSPPGRLFMSTSTGTLTVTDRPEVLARIETYLNGTNQSITRQILFNVKVFEVTLTDQDQLGLDWSAVYNSLSNKWGLSLSNTVPGLSTSAISGSIGIVDTANSAWAGSSAIIKALAEQGRVSNVRSPSVTTLNLQPAPIQIGNVQGYVASSSTTTTASVGSSTALTPATITSGFNMTLLPRVLSNSKDEMLLMVTINMSSKPVFQTFTSNGSSVQTPDYDAKSLSPKVKLRSGQTLILSGFDEMDEDATKIGVGSPGFFGLGGGQTRTSTHSVLVVLITPILLGSATNNGEADNIAAVAVHTFDWAA